MGATVGYISTSQQSQHAVAGVELTLDMRSIQTRSAMSFILIFRQSIIGLMILEIMTMFKSSRLREALNSI